MVSNDFHVPPNAPNDVKLSNLTSHKAVSRTCTGVVLLNFCINYSLLGKNDTAKVRFPSCLRVWLFPLLLHNSLCVLGRDLGPKCTSQLWQQNSSKTSQHPSRWRREHESYLSQSLPVALLTSSVGDRNRPWCQTAASPLLRGVIWGGLGIWQGNPPWRLEDLDEVAGETDVWAALHALLWKWKWPWPG